MKVATDQAKPDATRVMRIVFITLLLDILAFTIILPLLPRLVDYYRIQEGHREDTLLGQAMLLIGQFRQWTRTTTATASTSPNTSPGAAVDTSLDTVLLGGALGSLFSFLQYVASPAIGRLSDRLGRRKVLLISLVGNLLSCVLWLLAGNFSLFLLARVVGGLSEANVQLAVAMITDVTERSGRSRGLAMVGIAFAIGFTVGPAMGAYFASSWHLPHLMPRFADWGLNPYSGAAMFALLLLLIETLLVALYLDETAQCRVSSAADSQHASNLGVDKHKRQQNLATLNRLHLLHLLLFSGMEYTLTFFTHDVHGYTPMQNGKLLGFIGIISALVQGGYVRRVAWRVGEKRIVVQGVLACAGALVLVALSAYTGNTSLLWIAGLLLAFTSATVVNCLTSLASMQCDDEAESEPTSDRAAGSSANNDIGRIARGAALGQFRSLGQLGRACGPVLACTFYWLSGAIACYTSGAVCMIAVAGAVYITAPDRPASARKKA